MRGQWIILAVAVVLIVLALAPTEVKRLDPIVTEISDEVMLTEDGTRYLVHPSKIRGGGPPKDGIPSIDDPNFVSVEEADRWIEDNELVLAIEHKGVERAYPLQIMVWHEIVNDIIAGDPILITWCPLCGSAHGFERVINGQEVEFGTSGKLYNSNLVMYDRLTDTYWSQIGGRAIVGELTGIVLTQVDMDTVPWREWKATHPSGEVLDKTTGFARPYGTDPYGNYYEDSFLIFPVDNEDNRVHPKTVIFGIEVNGEFKAYKEEDLEALGMIEDTVAGVPISLVRDSDSAEVRITNKNSGEIIVKNRDFWFAWYAFHPTTTLYGV